VCLVVLGRYVPDLDVVLTLMSDRPALAADVAYYQRLIAMDRDEAPEIVEAELPARGAAGVYDDVMIPALNYARRDRERGILSDDPYAFVVRVSRALVDEVVAPAVAAAAAPSTLAPATRGRVLGCPARDEADEVALHMLADLLAPAGVAVDVVSAESLTAEVVAQAEHARPACVCVATLQPGGLAQTRYLVKRLRARFADGCLLVGRWGVGGGPGDDAATFLAAGATRAATTLAATRDQVLELVPVAAVSPLARSA